MNSNKLDTLKQVASIHGTPCFVYFYDDVRKRISEINDSFGKRFQISYAVKANPNPFIIQKLAMHIKYLDVSSAGELSNCLKAGWTGNNISFTGPGKTDDELLFALRNKTGEVVLESICEAERLNMFALSLGIQQRVLIRISPSQVPRGFGGHMAGRPCAFGIDEEELEIAIQNIGKMKGLTLSGFHIYSGTQCLNPESIVANWKIYIEIFQRATAISRIEPNKLIFGSGLGIPYYENDKAICLKEIADETNLMLDRLRRKKSFLRTLFLLETGRFLLGEAGIYITKVVRKKISRGAKICICDGGMNHNLAACGLLGMVMPRNYKIIKIDDQRGEHEEFQIAGPLCTSLDTLGRNVKLPGLNVGNLIGILGTGAYGLTSSPYKFISHKLPKEFLVDVDGNNKIVEDISELEKF